MTPDNEKILINPLKIKIEDMPMVVFSMDSNNLFSWLIRIKTKGLYNHVMFLTPNGFASQVLTYRMTPVKDYMKRGVQMKFFKIKDLTDKERENLYVIITNRLKLPWWKRKYDVIGVLGQLTDLRCIQNPWTRYCSEQVSEDLKKAVIVDSPLRPNPEELEEWLKISPRFAYAGHWIGD